MRIASAKKSARPRLRRGRPFRALRALSPGNARGQGPKIQVQGMDPLAGFQRAEPSGKVAF
jgi:hypothetical protein